MRAYVRLGLTAGYAIKGIMGGFEGLVAGKVSGGAGDQWLDGLLGMIFSIVD